jgi:hypothetical protein
MKNHVLLLLGLQFSLVQLGTAQNKGNETVFLQLDPISKENVSKKSFLSMKERSTAPKDATSTTDATPSLTESITGIGKENQPLFLDSLSSTEKVDEEDETGKLSI